MFIWLKQKKMLPELGFELQTSRFRGERVNTSTTGTYKIIIIISSNCEYTPCGLMQLLEMMMMMMMNNLKNTILF
jgi:hypothetical protein